MYFSGYNPVPAAERKNRAWLHSHHRAKPSPLFYIILLFSRRSVIFRYEHLKQSRVVHGRFERDVLTKFRVSIRQVIAGID